MTSRKVADHRPMEYFHGFQDQVIEAGRKDVLVGMDYFLRLSNHTPAYRVNHVPGNLTAFA